SAVHADVARVAERRDDLADHRAIVFDRVHLLDEDLTLAAVPSPRPTLVGPAETERKVGLAAREHFVERPLQQAPAAERVVVVTKAVDAVLARERRLLLAPLGHAKIVVAEFRRHVRLVVPWKERTCARDVGPLGEPESPPFVVFRDGMELRKVERDSAD